MPIFAQAIPAWFVADRVKPTRRGDSPLPGGGERGREIDWRLLPGGRDRCRWALLALDTVSRPEWPALLMS